MDISGSDEERTSVRYSGRSAKRKDGYIRIRRGEDECQVQRAVSQGNDGYFKVRRGKDEYQELEASQQMRVNMAGGRICLVKTKRG
jgi:hypothetical protein